MNIDLAEITDYLHAHIPLTRPMCVRVTEFDDVGIRLTAPLAPNLNHRETGFGGSIASLGILAGWTLLHLHLRDRGLSGRLVIQKSAIEFRLPVTADFDAMAALPPPRPWGRFFDALQRKGKARIKLRCDILCGGDKAAVVDGTFVAIRSADPPESE